MRMLAWALFLVLLDSVNGQNTVGAIPYADPSPVIDALLDDWPDDGALNFTMRNPSPIHANEVKAQFLWDEQYLYICAEVSDDHIVLLTADSTHLYLNDAVELYIDPLDDSGRRMDINDYQYIVDHRGASAVLKGEKGAILDSTKSAPKDYGISTVAFQAAATVLLDENGQSIGFVVEMAVPFAGMGANPKAGMSLKIDFCVDDADSLIDFKAWPEEVELPLYYCSNWDGYVDFSFPDHWRRFQLTGGPSVTSKIGRLLAPYWLYIVLGLVLAAGLIIVWQARRIAQLKDVLPKTTIDPALTMGLLEVHSPAAEVANASAAASQPSSLDVEEVQTSESPGVVAGRVPLGIKHPLVERCRQLVLARLDEELMMEALASECAVSLRQLQRIFKEEINMSPGNFVVIIKMERAAELLRSGKHNVSEAAWQLGYQDSGYFSRVFKKYHGVSPKQYVVGGVS